MNQMGISAYERIVQDQPAQKVAIVSGRTRISYYSKYCAETSNKSLGHKQFLPTRAEIIKTRSDTFKLAAKENWVAEFLFLDKCLFYNINALFNINFDLNNYKTIKYF